MRTTKLAGDMLDTIPHVMRTIRNEMRDIAKSVLSVPQFRLLVRLSRGNSTNSELSAWLGLSKPALTRMIDGLVKKGFVARTQEAADRRQNKIELTAKGRKQYQKVTGVVRDRFSRDLLNLSQKEQDVLQNSLDVLRKLFP